MTSKPPADQPKGPRNPRVVEASRLHRSTDRRERGQGLVEGPHLLAEAIDAGVAIRVVFALPGDRTSRDLSLEAGLEVVTVSEAALARLADTRNPKGPIAIFDIPHFGLEPGRDLLVAWAVSDPGNVGALIRTAAAFGWGFAFTEGSADPWSPKTLRAGSGGHFRTPITKIGGIADLEGWTTVATVARGGDDPALLEGRPTAVLIGEEAHGLPAEIAAAAAVKATIPMPGGTESLNAAVAAGILVYELSRR